jgi:hypothetical protein
MNANSEVGVRLLADYLQIQLLALSAGKLPIIPLDRRLSAPLTTRQPLYLRRNIENDKLSIRLDGS